MAGAGLTRVARRRRSLPSGYFETLYAAGGDPWRLATSLYERRKYDATLAALPRRRYASGLEIGCSVGVLTDRLAPRCGRLLAVDTAAGAVLRARRRCRRHGHVAVERMHLPDRLPAGRFDLIVLSEVLYYWSGRDLGRIAAFVRRALVPGGDAILVHYLRATDYPLSGDAAAGRFVRALHPACRRRAGRRTRDYRIDVLRAGG